VTLRQAQRALVVDASAAIPFLQGDPEWNRRWEEWTARGDMLLAPPHFAFEVANGLLRGTSIRSATHVSDLIRQLFAVGVEVVDRRLDGLLEAIRLAVGHDLTVYDAAYLGIAIDVDGELATLDAALAAAAAKEGVPLVG
jgi:predicted nucleic acid-binding protein